MQGNSFNKSWLLTNNFPSTWGTLHISLHAPWAFISFIPLPLFLCQNILPSCFLMYYLVCTATDHDHAPLLLFASQSEDWDRSVQLVALGHALGHWLASAGIWDTGHGTFAVQYVVV